jgi:hypothetical protein
MKSTLAMLLSVAFVAAGLSGCSRDSRPERAPSEGTPAPAAAPAPSPAQAPVPTPTPAPAAAPMAPKIVEGYESTGWTALDWGFPSKVTIVENKDDGNHVLSVQGEASDKQAEKTAFGRRLSPPLDLTKQTVLTFKACNGGKNPIQLAVLFVAGDNDMYESRQIKLAPGRQDAEIPLNDATFKSNTNKWAAYELKFERREMVREMIFLIYHDPKDLPSLSLDVVFFRSR